MEVRQLIVQLRRGIRLILVSTLLATMVAVLVASRLPVLYEARASLIAQNLASTYAEVARSRPLLADVVGSLGLDVPLDDLAERVQARPSQTSALLTISVRDADAARAAAIANAIAEQLVARAPEVTGSSEETLQAIREDLAVAQREIDRTEELIEGLSALPEPTPEDVARLEAQRVQLGSLLALRTGLQSAAITYTQSVVTIVDPAIPPTRPSSPSLPLVAIVGAWAGLIVGLALVLVPIYLRDASSRRASSADG